MQVGFTPDQMQFRDVVDRFMADKSPPTEVRRLMESEQGYDSAVWLKLSQEVGLLGTHIPEALGGFGFGHVEQGIISEAMGRYLYCGPYFSSAVMAGYALLNGAEETHQTRLLSAIAGGEVIAAVGLDNLDDPSQVGHSLSEHQGRVSGTAPMVVDAHVADLLLVVVQSADDLALYEVDAGDAEIRPLDCLDPTRKLSAVTLRDAAAERLGGFSAAGFARYWDEMNTALAHEMIGGCDHLFSSTIEYIKMRVQFGRLIGSFQALKHRCADLLLELELAKAATYQAARYLDTGEGQAYAPNMAKALAADAYMAIAKAAIQLRGGIGFTWEEDTHLWFKRAKSSEVLLGTANWHREAMVKRMEETADV